MSLDLSIFYFFNNMAGVFKFFDTLVIFFANYFQYFLVALFILLLFFVNEFKLKKMLVFLSVFLSVAVSRLGITEIIRFFYNRPRPFLTHEVTELFLKASPSFPSGHSAFFFAMSTAIYFFNKKWGIVFFLASTVIAVSRIIAGVHYPSDILGGAFIGVASAWVVCYMVKKYSHRD